MRATRLPLLALAASCATTSTTTAKGGPRGLRASDHIDMAHQQDEQARQQATMQPRFDAVDQRGVTWMRAWDTTADHERIADEHRSRAAVLQAAYEEACGQRTPEEVSVSPLQRYAVSGWSTTTGAIMYLDPRAGEPDKLLADMKCHRAWMMLAPAGMDDCPLDLPGIALDARGDAEGITVSIIVRDPNLVDELHRRIAHELEAGAELRRKGVR